MAIPSYGGEALFANMYAAYYALPEPVRRRVAGMQVEFAYGGRTRQDIELLEPENQALPPAVRPGVRTHEETDRKSLYSNPVHFLCFVGMPKAESDAVALELFGQMVQPGAECRRKRRAHDLLVRDNRFLSHAAAGDYPIEEMRSHWRSTTIR